jgi:predicted ATP-grasp superfamily ATP-dependent carboligase
MVVKTQFYPSVRAHGIPHPRTLLLQDMPLDEIPQHLSFPVFVRPAQTLLFGAHFRGKGFVAGNVRELRGYLQRAQDAQLNVLVQEVIPGPTTAGYAIEGYIDHGGRVIMCFATQKIRQPSMFSNTTIDVTIPRAHLKGFDIVILDYLRQMGYRGLFGAEMKWDARDGQFKFLEVNARCMGGNYQGAACGVNHILAAYQDSLGRPVKPVHHYVPGFYYIELLYDLAAMGRLAWRHREWRPDLRPYTHYHLFNYLRRGDNRPFLKGAKTFLQSLVSRAP